MAIFETAFNKTMAFEGGYANNPNDNGGETYRGVARNFFPNWKGWAIVDNYKKAPMSAKALNGVLAGNQQIQQYVKDFYRSNFWNPIMGDGINDQNVANNMFDFAVNSGVNRAVRYAQRVAGTEQDGVMGRITLGAINGHEGFVAEYKEARLAFFDKIVANNPSQSVFLNGWRNRVDNA